MELVHNSTGLVLWMYSLHALGFVTIFAFFFIRLYLGTIENPDAVPAMIKGWRWAGRVEETASGLAQTVGA